MADQMLFTDTVEEFMEQYKIVDSEGIYMSKGSELVPIFRMKQWFEHKPERKTGKWVGVKEYCEHLNETAVGKHYMPTGMFVGFFCDQCWEQNLEKKNYCPNCGSSMMEGTQP